MSKDNLAVLFYLFADIFPYILEKNHDFPMQKNAYVIVDFGDACNENL